MLHEHEVSNETKKTMNQLMINPDVTLIHNGNEYLLYSKVAKKYYQIGNSAVELFRLLEKQCSTAEELVTQFCEKHDKYNDVQVEKQLHLFIKQLVGKGLIVYKGFETTNEIHSKGEKSSKFRVVKLGTYKINNMMDLFFKRKNREAKSPSKITLYFIGVLFIVLLSYLIYAFFNFNPEIRPPSASLLFYIAPWILMHLLLHELSHAFTCKVLGGDIREIGVGLLYYILPVAYLDLTDTYKLPRKSRAIISIAGPLFDLISLSITVTIIMTQGGQLQDIAYYIMGIQIFVFLINTNLLLPSDLYRFIESLTKDMNLRRNSFQYLKSILLNKEKPQYLNSMSKRKEVIYISYSVVASLYLMVFISTLLLFYVTSISKNLF
ncbi:PqqD family peptide modification chaperone [Virgibacillus dokdonensis]|uniref:PqqD family peptide modification chaperone n=1 Tax=Virgibacillus dokdonensis TaxID=302167 RepID=UPI000989A82F|nr:PqqD family peptide modification chaperone [Virgibacillus dokdonensis]